MSLIKCCFYNKYSGQNPFCFLFHITCHIQMDPNYQFEKRIASWAIPMDNNIQFIEYKSPSTRLEKEPTYQPAFRYQSSKGIPTGTRFKMQDKLQEMYIGLLPNDEWLAKELAKENEREIFESSSTNTFYTARMNEKYRSLRYIKEFEQKITK